MARAAEEVTAVRIAAAIAEAASRSLNVNNRNSVKRLRSELNGLSVRNRRDNSVRIVRSGGSSVNSKWAVDGSVNRYSVNRYSGSKALIAAR